MVADILGLTQAAISDLRQDGLSLAQIAERQKVDPQKLVDALTKQWTARIDVRVQNGALTTAQATALKAQLATRAKDMVYRTTLGGMQGAAVGAGPASAPGPPGRRRAPVRRAPGWAAGAAVPGTAPATEPAPGRPSRRLRQHGPGLARSPRHPARRPGLQRSGRPRMLSP